MSKKGKREAKAKNAKKILLVFPSVKEVENAIIPLIQISSALNGDWFVSIHQVSLFRGAEHKSPK